MLEQPDIAETVAGRPLQRVELIPQADDLARRELGSMAVDQSARLLDVFLVHGQADVAEAFDRQREDAPHRAGRDDGRNPVRFEQPAHDARLHVGVRPEDHDEGTGGHGVLALHHGGNEDTENFHTCTLLSSFPLWWRVSVPPSPSTTASTLSRIIVMSSC